MNPQNIIRTLIGAICMAPFFLIAQSPLHQQYALDRVLLKLAPDAATTELAQLIGEQEILLPFDERAQLKGDRWYLAWINPGASTQPSSGEEMEKWLEELRKNEALEFAEAFVVGENGQMVGQTNEVWVQMKPGKKVEDVANSVNAASFRPSPYHSGWWIIQLPRQRSRGNLEVAFALQSHADVVTAEPNLLYELDVTTNDPHFLRQWALENKGLPIQGNGTAGADMSVPAAWTVTTGRSDIKIAIIDSGVDTAHADLKDNLLAGFDATGGGSLGYPNTTYPSDGHGTACAGIAAAKADNGIGVAGVCYDCSLVPIKLFTYIFNPFGEPLPFATGGDMADAIAWAWKEGDADIVSNSWGLTDPLLGALPGGTGIVEAALEVALDSARNGRGIPMLFSSGNEDSAPIWPGRRAGLISVNATSPCDERKTPTSCDLQNWTGSWGDSLDIAAPGVAIASTDMSGGNGYDGSDYTFGFGGTSAACPNAAGVMGLILSVDPSMDLERARGILESTCDKVGGYTYTPGSPNGSWSQELGYGRVNAFAAVQAAVSVGQGEMAFPREHRWQMYPQPAVESVTVGYELTEGGRTEMWLLDARGVTVGQLFDSKEAKGSYVHDLSLEEFHVPGGIYFVKVKLNGQYFFDKLLIQK